MVSKADLSGLTVSQLKALCKREGISGYSTLRKAEIIQLILDNAAPSLDVGSQVHASRVSSKKVHSRAATEKKVEKSKKLKEKQEQEVTKLQSSSRAATTETVETRSGAKTVKKAPPPPVEKEKVEQRFQDIPAGEQRYILNKKFDKKAIKLLMLKRRDFQGMPMKKLEKLLESLEIEKGRLVVYQPTDKMLRDFIDESVAIINEVREEMLNKAEREYIDKVLPTILERPKNKEKINTILGKVDRYFTELDAAREIVESVKFKPSPPFREEYLASIIVDRIRDNKIVVTSPSD